MRLGQPPGLPVKEPAMTYLVHSADAQPFEPLPAPASSPGKIRLTRTTCKPRESRHAAQIRGSTSGRGQTCAGKRADVRTACSGCAGAWKISLSCSPWRCLMSWPSCPFPVVSSGTPESIAPCGRFPHCQPYCARNGMPIWRSSARASSSDFAVVTIVMFMPFILSTFE